MQSRGRRSGGVRTRWGPAGVLNAAVLLLSLKIPLAAAARVRHDAPCFEICQTLLQPVLFSDIPGLRNDTASPPPSPLPPALRPCASRLAASSLFLCSAEFCTAPERAAGLALLNETCQRGLDVRLPSLSIVDGYTDEDVARLRRLQRGEFGWVGDAANGTVFEEPVLPEEGLFESLFNTFAAWGTVWRKHLEYSFGLFVFWALVIAVGLSYRMLARWDARPAACPKRGGWIPLDHCDEDVEEFGSSPKSTSRTSLPRQWIKRHITVPATFGQKSSQSFGWYTVPPRVQSLTLAAFVVMNVVFCCHGYWVFEGNLYWPDTRTQWLRYVADRTGIISFANFPLIWLFGMRNNLLMWLTGWDFGTYNNFHRWVARVATVQAIVHSVAYTVQVFDSTGWDGFIAYFDQFFWWTGEIATVLMSLLLGFSLFWFRRNTYEMFLIVHIGFSVVILYTMWAHVTIFDGRFDPPIWICCAIWLLDRVLRVARTLSFNLRFWSPVKAEASYEPATNMVRLEIPADTALYQPAPGTFYYLHVLNDGRFWESHPFTMAKLADDVQGGGRIGEEERSGRVSPAMSDEEEHLLAGHKPAQVTSTSTTTTRSHIGKWWPRKSSTGRGASSRMTFLIRPYDGFTARLRDKAVRAAAHEPPSAMTPTASHLDGGDGGIGSVPASLRVLVEGPYGHTQPLDRYDNIVFVVGGSGIVVPMAYISGLLRASSSSSSSSRTSSSQLQTQHHHQQTQTQTQQRIRRESTTSMASHLSRHANTRLRGVRIIWAVREAALAETVLGGGKRDFDAEVMADERFSVRVYVTKAQPHSEEIPVRQHAKGGKTKKQQQQQQQQRQHGGVCEGSSSSSSSSSSSTTGDDDSASGQRADVEILHGRPLVLHEIEDFAAEFAHGSLAVVACGPGRMADDARRTVVEMQAGGSSGGESKASRRRTVDFFEESFNW